ncbi:hypothetical protein BH18CHL1_BH18CHL1_09300 [soil metagenome]
MDHRTAAAPPLGSPPGPSLWRNRDFRVFLGGQGASAFGDAVTVTALPLLVLLLTGSGVTMGVVGVLIRICSSGYQLARWPIAGTGGD